METKNRGDTMVFIVFSYNSTGFRPSTIEIQFENDLLNENLKSKLTKQLSTFSEQEFLEGYKAFFKL